MEPAVQQSQALPSPGSLVLYDVGVQEGISVLLASQGVEGGLHAHERFGTAGLQSQVYGLKNPVYQQAIRVLVPLPLGQGADRPHGDEQQTGQTGHEPGPTGLEHDRPPRGAEFGFA
jgi:hypothetical protein